MMGSGLGHFGDMWLMTVLSLILNSICGRHVVTK